jgi:hypothetical protein
MKWTTVTKWFSYIRMIFLESLEIFIRFSKNSLLLCCVTMCENGIETDENTQTRALSDQPQC